MTVDWLIVFGGLFVMFWVLAWRRPAWDPIECHCTNPDPDRIGECSHCRRLVL